MTDGLFRYVPQIEQAWPDLDGQVLQLLAERDRQLEDYLSRLGGRSSGVRSVEIVIAPVDATPDAKESADYVLDGVVDAFTVQTAIDYLFNDSPFGAGSIVILAGDVTFDAVISVPDFIIVRGVGQDTVVETIASPCFQLSGNSSCVGDMTITTASAADYAIEVVSGARHFVHDLSTNGIVHLEGDASRLQDSNAGVVIVESGAGVLVSDTTLTGLQLQASSSRCRATNCTMPASSTGAPIVSLAGTDNAISDCTFYARATTNNTGDMVEVLGTRNSFTGNIVRGSNSSFRHAYGVRVLVAAVDARVRFNDLRAGAAGAWGTAAYADAGSGTLSSDNDT